MSKIEIIDDRDDFDVYYKQIKDFKKFRACIIDFEKAFNDLRITNEMEYRLSLYNNLSNEVQDFFISNNKLFVAPTGNNAKNPIEISIKLLDQSWNDKTKILINSLIHRNIFLIDEIKQEIGDRSIEEVLKIYKCVKLMNNPKTRTPILLEKNQQGNIVIVTSKNEKNEPVDTIRILPENMSSSSINELNKQKILNILFQEESDYTLIYYDTERNIDVLRCKDIDKNNSCIFFGPLSIPLNNDQVTDELTESNAREIIKTFMQEKKILEVFDSKLGWIKIIQKGHNRIIAKVEINNKYFSYLLPHEFTDASDFLLPDVRNMIVENLKQSIDSGVVDEN